MNRNTPSLEEIAQAYIANDYQQRRTARELGLPPSTLRDQIYRARQQGLLPKSDPQFKITKSANSIAVYSKSHDVTTVEDAISKAGIDLNLWDIYETEVNSYEVVGKRNTGQKKDAEGNIVWGEQQIWREPLWQIKVKLRRKAPKFIQDGLASFLKEIQARSPYKSERRKPSGNYLLELSLYDVHFGKLCFEISAGHTYSLEQAHTAYVASADYLLSATQHYGIERIVFPIGHDLFQVNNFAGTTKKGTIVDRLPESFADVFKAAVLAVAEVVNMASSVAPVEAIWVPGNHDPETSWYLVQVLMALFKDNPNVSFDDRQLQRKYYKYGSTLFGYVHGSEEKVGDLPLLMATECPVDWGASKYRCWRTGHFHHKKETSYSLGDTFNGVRVDIMPSLSGTDEWHYQKGYVKNLRTAEGWLWEKTSGYAGHFSTPPLED